MSNLREISLYSLIKKAFPAAPKPYTPGAQPPKPEYFGPGAEEAKLPRSQRGLRPTGQALESPASTNRDIVDELAEFYKAPNPVYVPRKPEHFVPNPLPKPASRLNNRDTQDFINLYKK